MSEDGWGSDLGQTKKKRGLPGWVWGCGIGCGLFLIVVLVVSWLGFRVFQKAIDPERVWANVDEVLPVVERPSDLTAFQFPVEVDGATMFIFTNPSGGRSIVLLSGELDEEGQDMRSELLDASTEESVGGPLGDFGRHDLEESTVTVQGREIGCVRYGSMPEEGGGGMLSGLAEMDGSTIALDLAAEGSDRLLMLIMTNRGQESSVSDEEVIDFLDHFRLPGGARDQVLEIEAEDAEGADTVEETLPETPVDPEPANEE